MAILTQVDEKTFLEVLRESSEVILHRPKWKWQRRHVYAVVSGAYCYWVMAKEPLPIPPGRAIRMVWSILLG